MKYAFNTVKDGYQTFTTDSNIKFNNDQLFFNNANEAFKFLYYARDNKFIIKFDENLNLNLLTILSQHGAQIKFEVDNNTSSIFKSFKLKLKLLRYSLGPSKSFNPVVYQVNRGSESLYMLEGYVIDNLDAPYTGDYIYGFTQIEDIPFNCRLVTTDKTFDFINDELQAQENCENVQYSIVGNKIFKYLFIPCVYVYSGRKVDDKIEIKMFLQGYQHFSQQFVINCQSTFKVTNNSDWQYYSKNAEQFKSYFITLEIENINQDVSLKYGEQDVRILFARNIQNGCIINDLIFSNNKHSFNVNPQVESFMSKKYKQYQALKMSCNDDFYLFQDRQDKADDNAEALYRYYMTNSNKQIYFVLDRDCQCWNRLKAEGFNLVEFGSEDHKQKFLTASKIISSHAARRIYDPFYPSKEYISLEKFKFVFLQHGIIMGEHHGFLDIVNNPKIDLFITSNDQEKELVESFSGYTNVQAVGMPRYDKYQKNIITREYIVYAPSWNVMYRDDLANSEYVHEIEKVLNSDVLYDELINAGVDLYLILHPEFIKENLTLRNKYNHRILKNDEFLYSDVLSNASALITDYSSLFFDFLFQNKIVIQHKPYKLHHENDRLSGYQAALYETFDINQLEQQIIAFRGNLFKISEEKEQVINKFFKYHDQDNCKRNYELIESM